MSGPYTMYEWPDKDIWWELVERYGVTVLYTAPTAPGRGGCSGGGLPKTRSGKIMRHLLRDIAEGRELGDVTTLRDPDVMEQLQHSIRARADEDE